MKFDMKSAVIGATIGAVLGVLTMLLLQAPVFPPVAWPSVIWVSACAVALATKGSESFEFSTVAIGGAFITIFATLILSVVLNCPTCRLS